MNAIEQRYRARTPASAATGARAARVMPGGDTRSVTYYRPYPLTIARGQGPFLWDIDGNRYIDLLGNYTSLVHGNAYPPIVEAIARASAQGTAWPARNEAQIELAGNLSASASPRSSACACAIRAARQECWPRNCRAA